MLERHLYYDKEGKNISLTEWADLFEDMGYRKIGDSYIKNYHISTVWIGLNHNIFFDAPICIFETMIFCEDEEDELNNYMERYSTLEEAFEGHKQAISMAKEAKMKIEDMEELIKGMSNILELKKMVDSIEEDAKEEEAKEKEKKEAFLSCPIVNELQKRFEEIVVWGFGNFEDKSGLSKKEALKQWEKLHPKLPVPSVFKSELNQPTVTIIGILLDVYPLYLKDKERKCRCDNVN